MNIWWNYYAFLNTIMVKSPLEVDRHDNGATINTIGNAKNVRMNQFREPIVILGYYLTTMKFFVFYLFYLAVEQSLAADSAVI